MAVEKIYEKQTAFVSSPLDTYNSGSSANQLMGQIFTVGTVGTNENHICTKVRVYLKKVGSPTGTGKVQIRSSSSGTPQDEILAEVSYDPSTLSTSYAWIEYTFDIPVELVASTEYALVITYPTGGTHDNSNEVQWDAQASNPYAGGTSTSSTTDGVSWSTSTNDQAFQIIGNTWNGTLCEYNDVLGKTGANVASALSTGNKFQLLNNFVLQAESVVNTMTRYNWNDVYSTLNVDVKYVLAEAVSNLAGIYGIAYDMSGYTDRIEAEDMINILRDNFIQRINLLRDLKQQDFINGA